ncbi:unnamed protein product, partial [marine sediment metagenome]
FDSGGRSMSIRVNAIGIELNQDFMLIDKKKDAHR